MGGEWWRTSEWEGRAVSRAVKRGITRYGLGQKGAVRSLSPVTDVPKWQFALEVLNADRSPDLQYVEKTSIVTVLIFNYLSCYTIKRSSLASGSSVSVYTTVEDQMRHRRSIL